MGLTLLWVWLGDVVGSWHRAIFFYTAYQEVGYCLSWRSALALPVHPSPLAFRSCSLAVIIVYYGLLYMSIGTLYKVYRMFLVNFIL